MTTTLAGDSDLDSEHHKEVQKQYYDLQGILIYSFDNIHIKKCRKIHTHTIVFFSQMETKRPLPS